MVTITDAASSKLTEVIRQQTEHGGRVYGLRLTAAPGCCSGAQYGMALADKVEENDWQGDFGGVKVLIDPDSAPLLQGVSIDYVETPQGAGFTVSNPNAVAEEKSGGCGPGCACGS